MAQLTNFDEVIEQLKDHLVEYLEEKEINTNKQFSCISKDHNDSHPSCGIMPGKQRWNCFGCGARGDIFDAAHNLEGKPISGPNFVPETVIPLAKKFGINFKERELTPEEKYRIETYNAYKKASDYISVHPSPDALEEIKKRKWNSLYCRERGIGSVESNKNFREYLNAQGFTSKFLNDIDLIRNNLFNENNLIFTICDEVGRPCGFAAKNLKWNPNDKNSSKYINSYNTGTDIKCNIYDKSRRLYNIHNARHKAGPIYVFEGYADVETALQNNIENVVGIGGTAFTEFHVTELKKIGRTDIILCLDGDEPGLKRTNKIVDMFSGHNEFRLQIVCIPEELDPDDFIRDRGAHKFLDLKKYSAFEWKLGQYDDRVDPSLISNEMIKIIALESSSRIREEMAEALARKVTHSKSAILDDVEKIINAESLEKESQRKTILENLQLNLRHYPSDWRIFINNATSELDAMDLVYSDETFSPNSFLKDVREIKATEEEYSSELKGYNLGNWTILEKVLNGDWESTLNLVGGSPNTGKTGWMSQLALRVVLNNKDRNVMVLFQTIDDTTHQFLTRIICELARKEYPVITLNMIKNPNGYPQSRRILRAREKAYNEFIALAGDSRFIIRGAEQRGGNTIKFCNDWIKYNTKKYQDRKIIYFLDNFHRLRDFSGMKDERIRFKLLSNSIKDIAKLYNIPIWATVEYTKAAGLGRPNNSDISESVAMEYDGNFIMHIYNELHVLKEEAKRFHETINSKGIKVKMPVVEGIVGKNKITEFKGSIFWDFFTEQSRFDQITREEISRREQATQIQPVRPGV